MGVRWVTYMGQRLSRVAFLESRLARHSVTLRCRLGHLPFLPFQISEESDTRSQCQSIADHGTRWCGMMG